VDAEEAELPCAIQDNRNGSYTLSFTIVAAGPFTVLLEERGTAAAGAAEGGRGGGGGGAADDAERRLEMAGLCECREVSKSTFQKHDSAPHTRTLSHSHTLTLSHSHTVSHSHTHPHTLSTGGREQVRAGSNRSDGRRVDGGAARHRHGAAM
jgi:hypothetical protein